MEKLSNCSISEPRAVPIPFHLLVFHRQQRPRQRLYFNHFQLRRRLNFAAISLSSERATEPLLARLSHSHDLQSETLQILEWDKLCKQLSFFTSTAMGRAAALSAAVPLGRSLEEAQRLLKQTTAALALSQPLDFTGIVDVFPIVKSALSGEMVTISELCAVKRMLRATRKVKEQLEVGPAGDSVARNCPLLEILHKCSFLAELEQHIEYCVDCNLSVILDRASDKMAMIRSERKRNMENLDSLLNGISQQIIQAGGTDSPIVTKRRSRMCIGIRASHRSLLPNGVILNVSSSGATYFMEPKEAIELNNKEVRLANSEKDEERAILSLLATEIAESAEDITYLLERIQEVDLAVARARHARWLNGVRPTLNSVADSESFSVDIEGIHHPLLLEYSLDSVADEFNSSSSSNKGWKIDTAVHRVVSEGKPDFPVPIDIKIRSATKVVIISGPNAGGKTASMKTLGLASLMSKAGMYLPANGSPKLPWFDLVLADIGDHQSLEESLSTFSGHILRICRILEMVSAESLVLIDEIGSGTDPSEGVALSTSILQYLKVRASLTVVTTHYTDLSRLRGTDARFDNAAMEFCLETLRPTYQVLWGSAGESNALKIARTIGFDVSIIERAESWMGRLVPEKQQERRGFLYQSLLEERKRLGGQASQAASFHSEVMDLYHEIKDEAEDLGSRERALIADETHKAQNEFQNAKSKIETIIQEFENQLEATDVKQLGSLMKEAETGIASIVRDHSHDVIYTVKEVDEATYTPQVGETVHVKHLGGKLATVVEVSEDDGTVMVKYGKVRARVDRNGIQATTESNRAVNSLRRFKKQPQSFRSLRNLRKLKEEEVPYGPMIQTSKNTVDLRGMRVEEASRVLNVEILARESHSVMYIVHGMGSGALKQCVLDILKNHSRVLKFDQENPVNYGCTVAFIK